MVGALLMRGMLAGLVAGLLCFGFLKVYGEPQVDGAITFETQLEKVKAEAEAKHLQGEGIAKQRRAIVDGLRESVAAFTDKIGEVSAQDALNLVLLTQYFDTMKEIGVSSGSKVILMPHSPGGMGDIANELRNAIIAANETTKAGK